MCQFYATTHSELLSPGSCIWLLNAPAMRRSGAAVFNCRQHNEGTMLVAVECGWGAAAVEALRRVPVASQATMIGREFPLDEPAGAILPRIC